jgi:hypothetical protein
MESGKTGFMSRVRRYSVVVSVHSLSAGTEEGAHSAGAVRHTNLDPGTQSALPILALTRGRIRNRYAAPNTEVTKKANTAKTNRSVSQSAFEDPAAENASLGVRIASTMAQILITIADITITNPTSVATTPPAE